MVAESGLQFLEALQNRQPALATRIAHFAELYQRKLWHQLTVAIEESLAVPEFRAPEVLIPFYNEFLATFAHKLNPLRLAHIAVIVAEQFGDHSEAGAQLRPCTPHPSHDEACRGGCTARMPV
jgi:26S proteasome regulatory subunit N9